MQIEIGDQLLPGELEVQRLGPLGDQVIGADPRAETAPAQQPPQDQHSGRANDQIDQHGLEGEHDLQGRIEIGEVEADHPRGGQRALDQLHVESIGQHENGVDQNDRQPAAIAPFVAGLVIFLFGADGGNARLAGLVGALGGMHGSRRLALARRVGTRRRLAQHDRQGLENAGAHWSLQVLRSSMTMHDGSTGQIMAQAPQPTQSFWMVGIQPRSRGSSCSGMR